MIITGDDDNHQKRAKRNHNITASKEKFNITYICMWRYLLIKYNILVVLQLNEDPNRCNSSF